MSWDNPHILDAICYDLILSDFPRGQNRARIQRLANGGPPYSDKEVEENNIEVNISDLTHTRLLHDARSQYANAFLKGSYYSRVSTDAGPVHKREARTVVVNREWNRMMKKSVRYYERLRAEFGQLVLHGISPGLWQDEDSWCPKPIGVEDVLLPSETLLGFENLPFMIFRRTFTAIELYNLTIPEKRDPGWQMPQVKRILDWLKEQATVLRALNWPEVWSPEKIEERTKQEAGGTLAGDRAPKIDVFDIYAFDDSQGTEGWIRRMIVDSWSEPQLIGGSVSTSRKTGAVGEVNGFLFTSGKRKVALDWKNIASFSFADLSATFPARYHSVRSLGWMLYAACHLGMRMRCKFYEAVLENLMMMFEVDNQQDAQNALKLNLVNRGFIDRTIKPVPAQNRWKPDVGLVELGIRDNAQVISENAMSWMQNQNFSSDKLQKTRFQVMAEMQAATALVGVALNQAYVYKEFQDREIFRRFLRKNSSDVDVLRFRARCLKQDVPAYMLNDPDAWEIKTERTMGGGNKTLEMAVAEWLMANRTAFDPDAQREILRKATLAYTDDPGLTMNLVPEEPAKVTPSVREAEHIAATLMSGIRVETMDGENNIHIANTLLRILAEKIAQGLQSGGVIPADKLAGLQSITQHAAERIQIIGEDPQQKQLATSMGQILGKVANELKAFQQRLQAMMEKQQQGNGQGQTGMDPKDIAKAQAIVLQAKTKADLAKMSHAQRTAQRDIQFQQKMRHDMQQHQANLAATDIEAASNIRRNRMTSTEE